MTDDILPWGRPDDTPPQPPRSKLRQFLATSTVIGVLSAGLLAPIVIPGGVAAREAANAFNALPATLPDVALPQQTKILAADGSVIATTWTQNRQVVPLAKIAPVMQQAIIATEDARFYQHGAVDLHGILRAAAADSASGSAAQGASTLTQQYVKNVLLLSAASSGQRQAAVEDSASRKIREARYAFAVEKQFTKQQILEKYLNIAYFGSGTYGIESAAQYYFGKPAAQLTLNEAALLAGVVQSPTAYDPTQYPQNALKRRNEVLGRMLAVKNITQAQYQQASAQPIKLDVTRHPNGCSTSYAPFFCEYVRATLDSDPAFGATQDERDARLEQGGLIIRTSLIPAVQRAAQKAVDSHVPRTSRVAAVDVVMQPGTGQVTAMAVNRTYGLDTSQNETEVPLATRAAFQPGSTFKLFTIATALEQGYSPNLTLGAGDCYHSPVFWNPPDGCFHNSTSAGAEATMQRAADLSVNTYFVRLAEKVGVMNIANMAQRLGVTSLPMTGPDKVTPKDGTITLGVYDVSPIDMATAYATIAARGERCEPLPIVSVTRADGRPTPQMPQRCTRVLPPEVADTAAQILQGVVDHGTGTNAQLSDRPAAGKTGTTDSNAAVWFDGFTPDYAAVVVAADPRGAAYPLRNVLGISRMHGGDLPAKIWHDTLTVAEQGLPVRDFPIPGPIGLLSDQSTVPNVAGLDVQDALSALEAAGLTVTPLPADSSGEVVTGTQPAAGAAVQDGQSITLQVQQP